MTYQLCWNSGRTLCRNAQGAHVLRELVSNLAGGWNGIGLHKLFLCFVMFDDWRFRRLLKLKWKEMGLAARHTSAEVYEHDGHMRGFSPVWWRLWIAKIGIRLLSFANNLGPTQWSLSREPLIACFAFVRLISGMNSLMIAERCLVVKLMLAGRTRHHPIYAKYKLLVETVLDRYQMKLAYSQYE